MLSLCRCEADVFKKYFLLNGHSSNYTKKNHSAFIIGVLPNVGSLSNFGVDLNTAFGRICSSKNFPGAVKKEKSTSLIYNFYGALGKSLVRYVPNAEFLDGRVVNLILPKSIHTYKITSTVYNDFNAEDSFKRFIHHVKGL